MISSQGPTPSVNQRVMVGWKAASQDEREEMCLQEGILIRGSSPPPPLPRNLMRMKEVDNCSSEWRTMLSLGQVVDIVFRSFVVATGMLIVAWYNECL